MTLWYSCKIRYFIISKARSNNGWNPYLWIIM